MEAIAARHFQVGKDVGGKLELGSVGVFPIAFEVGDSVIPTDGKLDDVFCAQGLEGSFKEKALVFVVVDDEQCVLGRLQCVRIVPDLRTRRKLFPRACARGKGAATYRESRGQCPLARVWAGDRPSGSRAAPWSECRSSTHPSSMRSAHPPSSNSLRSGNGMRDRRSATTRLRVWALRLAVPLSKISAVIFNARPVPAPGGFPRQRVPAGSSRFTRPPARVHRI